MKKTLLTLTVLCAIGVAGTNAQQLLLGWDFTSQTGAEVSLGDTDVGNNIDDSSTSLTRGSGATGTTLTNSFITAGFKNDGISTANTDYFQLTVQAATGFDFSISSIDSLLGGTISFESATGVTMAWAYSLDGTNFTLLPSSTSAAGISEPEFDLNTSSVAALQNISSVTLRFYASGDTTSGKWGFDNNDATAENIVALDGSDEGLAINGTVTPVAAPEPSTWALLGLGGIGLLVWNRRRHRIGA